jgi:hypothetical protein
MKPSFHAIKIAAIATLFSVSAASASDLLDGLNEPAPAQSQTYFSGIAVGIDGGGQFTSVQLNGFGGSFDGISSDGVIGGAHAEYLFAVDRFRFGAYGEGGFSNVNTRLETPGPSGDLLKQDSYYGTGLKAGVTAGGSTLLFARVGYDWSQWDFAEGVADADVGSWLIGGGVETMISENLSFGLGADYLLVDDVEAAGADYTSVFEDSEMLRVKARLTWRQ